MNLLLGSPSKSQGSSEAYTVRWIDMMIPSQTAMHL